MRVGKIAHASTVITAGDVCCDFNDFGCGGCQGFCETPGFCSPEPVCN